MAAELPPHVTITGSSGIGPISPRRPTKNCATRSRRSPPRRAPFTVRFDPPMRFMQSTVVVMAIDPNGPIRALHERIKSSGLSYEQPRFTFTPHCHAQLLSRAGAASDSVSCFAFASTNPSSIDSIQAYRAVDLTRTQKVLDLPLTGGPARA